MANSATEICNSALIKLGAARILNLEEDSREARLCAEQYPKIRDRLLREHPWNFSLKRAQLAKLSTEPEFDFESQFQLPSDCLRVERTDLLNDQEFAIEGDKILTNTDTLKILYRARVTNVSLFDETFAEVVALLLAVDLSYSLVQSITLRNQLNSEFVALLRAARSLDAQEGNFNRTVEADAFINERF